MNDLNLDPTFLDIELDAEVWLASERVALERLSELQSGDVLQLSHDPDAPIDLVVNGTIVASGELVVVEGRFGLRVTRTARQRLSEIEESVEQAEPPDPAPQEET